MKKLLSTLIIAGLLGCAGISADTYAAPAKAKPKAAAKAPAKKTDAKKEAPSNVSYKDVGPLELLRNTEGWIGQNVSFDATFVSFSPYALDYKPAMRTSKDYIAFLIKRPDVTQHTIPLSELKLIYPRQKVDKVVDLESGDEVKVKGKVFSAALGDPWVDVDQVVLVKKSPENLAKEAANKKKGKKEIDE